MQRDITVPERHGKMHGDHSICQAASDVIVGSEANARDQHANATSSANATTAAALRRRCNHGLAVGERVKSRESERAG